MKHDMSQFDELVARQITESAKPTIQAKVPAQAKAPEPRAHRETGRVCDCTAERAMLIVRGDRF